jgi:hypothetical protein
LRAKLWSSEVQLELHYESKDLLGDVELSRAFALSRTPKAEEHGTLRTDVSLNSWRVPAAALAVHRASLEPAGDHLAGKEAESSEKTSG